MKNRSKIVSIVFLSFIILAQIAFISVPTARAYSMQDFSISPNPSSMPLLVGHSYEFTLTATLPGGSGSNGVDVYFLPLAGQVSGTDLTINYVDTGNGANPIHIPRNGNSGSAKMILTIPLDATPGPLPLTVTAYDNPGGGGTMIGTFTVTLHVNQIPLVVQTSGLYSSTNVYIGGTKVGTAYDGAPYGPVWFQLDPSTGTVIIGAIGVDNTVSGSVQYFFSSWADSSSNPHPAITTSDPITLTANYVTKTSQITITSNPTGSNLMSVDGTTYSSPHTFIWAVGSTHNLEALSPVAGSSGTQYVYDNWSDNGAQTHNYIVSSTSPATIVANYKTQYSVTFAVTPNGAGTTNPSTGTIIWANAGALAISATSNPGYHFDHWSSNTGSITFSSTTDVSTTSAINSPGTITANFDYNPVTHFSVFAPGSVVAGSSFQITVTALDADGNTITGYSGLVHITSSDALAALPADATLTNGIGVFAVTLKTAGSQNIMASDNSIFGSTSVTVLADSSSTKLEVSAPSTATAGVPFSFTVTAKDTYGNTVTGYVGIIHFTSTSSGSLPSDSSLTSGTATFSATLTSSGTKTITATDKAQPLITGTSSIIVVAPAAQLYSLSITGYPSSINAGETFSTDVTITAYDNFGNIKTDYSGSIYFTSTDAKATLPYNESLKYSFTTSDAGSHTFSGSTFSLYTTGMQTINVTDGSISKESNSIKVNHSANGAGYFVVDTPGAANAGSTIAVTVTAKDQYGNTVTDFSGTVIFTSTDAKADLPATSTLDNGVGNFIATFKTAGSQTITAADSTNNEINGTSSVVVVGPALSGTSALVVTSQATVQAGLPCSVTVKAVDLYGNLVPDYTGIVHINSSDIQSTISSDSTLTGGIGVFTVTLRTAGTQVVTASDMDNSTIMGSTTITVTVDSTSAIHFDVTSPSFVDVNQAFSMTINAKDQFGNIVTGYSGTVHLSTSDSGSNVNLLNDYTFLAADSGSHQFKGLKLVTAGIQTIKTTDILTGISGTASIQVNVPANSADHLVVSSQASVSAGESFIVIVTVKDAFGNTVTGYTGSVHFTSTDSSAILPADYTFQAVDSGNKAFDGIILETAGEQTITSTDITTSSITGTSGNIAVTANAASPGSIKVTPTSAQIYAGTNQAFTAELFDIFGNSLGDVTNKVTWSINVEARGSWEQAKGTYTSEIASPDGSPWTVAASTEGLSGYSTLTVIHSIDTAKLSNVTITPIKSTIIVGETQSYTAIATDIYGNSWDVTANVSLTNGWSITSAAGGTWNVATYTSEKTGDWTVSGTYLTKDGTASLTVAPNSAYLTSITLSPKTQTITAGDSQTYKVIATDSFGNTWDVSTNAATVLAIDSGLGTYSWQNNVVAVTKAGIWTVTASYFGASDSATLTVEPKATSVVSLTISPLNQIIAAGESITYTAIATDSFGNSWAVSTDKNTNWKIDSVAAGSWNLATYTSAKQGTWTVTGTYMTVSDSASLTVTHATDIAYLDHITASVNPTTVAAPNAVTGTAIAYDIFGNSWDISTIANWAIPNGKDGGSWLVNVYTSKTAGTYNVQAEYEGKTAVVSLTVTHATDAAYLDHIVASVNPTAVSAPDKVTGSATAYDTFGNNWDVSTVATWSIPASLDGGTWAANIYTSNKAGTYTIQAKYEGKTANATLAVTHATDNAYLDQITIAPKQSTVSAGVSQTYTATAYDSFNNSWSIIATYNCSNATVNITGNSAYSNTTGNYIIVGSYGGKTDSATLTVTGHLSTVVSIAIAPKTVSIPSGTSQIFIATASDGYNLWDATNQVVWSIIESGDSGSWNQATGTYTSAKAGVWTVKAALNQNIDTAQLTVNANPALLDHITISPKSATIISGNSQAYSVAAYDQFGNSLGDVTSSTTITAPGTTVSGNSVSASLAGTYTVNATYNSKSDAATLVVTSALSSTTITSTTTITTTPKQNPITYTVTFTEYGLPDNTIWFLTFNGQTKSSNTTTITFTTQNGNYPWMVQTPITNSVTRYTADLANETLRVSGVVTQNINFTTQYYLDIQSLHGNVTGSGWYNANKTAQFSVAEDSRSQYAFSSWTGTGAGSYNGDNQNATVTMIGPIVEVANWDQVTSLWLVLLVILIVMGLLMAMLIWRRRRNKKKENNIEPNAPKKV